MNGIRQSIGAAPPAPVTSRNSCIGEQQIRPVPAGGTTELEDIHKTSYYGPGILYSIIFSFGGQETRYVGSTQAQTTPGDYWGMAKARLDDHARKDNDMAAAIAQNYALSVVKSWSCIGRFALHALEAEMIWALKGGAASGGYLVANGVLPTTKETLSLQLADGLHHRWITNDPMPVLPTRITPKVGRVRSMGTDSSF